MALRQVLYLEGGVILSMFINVQSKVIRFWLAKSTTCLAEVSVTVTRMSSGSLTSFTKWPRLLGSPSS